MSKPRITIKGQPELELPVSQPEPEPQPEPEEQPTEPTTRELLEQELARVDDLLARMVAVLTS